MPGGVISAVILETIKFLAEILVQIPALKLIASAYRSEVYVCILIWPCGVFETVYFTDPGIQPVYSSAISMKNSGIAWIEIEKEIPAMSSAAISPEVSRIVFMNKIILSVFLSLFILNVKETSHSIIGSHVGTMISLFDRRPDLYGKRLSGSYRIFGGICFSLKSSTVKIISKVTFRIIDHDIHRGSSQIVASYAVTICIIFIQIIAGIPGSV